MKKLFWRALDKASKPLGWAYAGLSVTALFLLWLIFLSPFLIVGYLIIQNA